MRSDDYCTLLYSRRNTYMREALATGPCHDCGLSALHRLQRHLDTASMENLYRLWDTYPDAVVEFSCYDHAAGVLGWNTVFWEVRDY